MRAFAIAIVAAIMAASVGVAEAKPWNDTLGRIKLELPRGWEANEFNAVSDAEKSYAEFFTPSNDCYLVAFVNANTAMSNPHDVRRYGIDISHFAADLWVRSANGITKVFPNQSAQFVSQSLDETNFWPIQRAVLNNADGAVHAAIQLRPGLDILTFCTSVSGGADAAPFDAILRSIGTPQDADLQAQAEARQAEIDAAAAAAAAAPPAEEPRRRR